MKIVCGTREEREYILHWFINPNEAFLYLGDEVYDFSDHHLDHFFSIYDFEILVVDNEYEEMGIHIKYYSRKFGILVDFPWWDHADKDIRQYNEENIPLGTLDSPYIDFEES
jgi:hypothetical protein